MLAIFYAAGICQSCILGEAEVFYYGKDKPDEFW